MKINCPICDKNIRKKTQVKNKEGDTKEVDFAFSCKKCKFIFYKNKESYCVNIYDDFDDVRYHVSTRFYEEKDNKGYFTLSAMDEEKCPGIFYAIYFFDRPSPYMSRGDINFKQIKKEDFSVEMFYNTFLEWFNK